jgi:hypothetical protein
MLPPEGEKRFDSYDEAAIERLLGDPKFAEGLRARGRQRARVHLGANGAADAGYLPARQGDARVNTAGERAVQLHSPLIGTAERRSPNGRVSAPV